MSGYHIPGQVKLTFTPRAGNLEAYEDARVFLAGRASRRLPGKATRLVAAGYDIAVRYHDTDVVTYHRDGRIAIRCGGWHSATTRSKIESYCPGVFTWRHEGRIHVARRAPTVDPIVAEAKAACVEMGLLTASAAFGDEGQPSLPLPGHAPIILWPNGVLADADETHEAAVQRIIAWRSRPPTTPRTRAKPDKSQLSFHL